MKGDGGRAACLGEASKLKYSKSESVGEVSKLKYSKAECLREASTLKCLKAENLGKANRLGNLKAEGAGGAESGGLKLKEEKRRGGLHWLNLVIFYCRGEEEGVHK